MADSDSIRFGDARLPARFWSKVRVDESGCWIWIGTRHGGGYGLISIDGVNRRAHRIAYQTLRGPIPDNLVCDHLCRVTACVNPSHIEIVTHRENKVRGIGFAAQNAKKTHCPNGHPYDRVIPPRANTDRAEWRRCRICENEMARARYRLAKGRTPPPGQEER